MSGGFIVSSTGNVLARQISARGRVLLALALLGLASLAWRVLTLGMAGFHARSEPLEALRWRPAHAEARLREFERGKIARYAEAGNQARAREAIRAAPLDGRGYWWLARIAEAARDQPSAERLNELAANRGPRNVRVLAWLVDRELKRDDFARGISRIDQMLRVQPELAERLRPAIIQLAISPSSRGELARVMARYPPWRHDVMPMLFASAPDSAPLMPFVDLLAKEPPGLTPVEWKTWIDRLGYDRNWGAAYLVWMQSLKPEESARIGNVFNGGFEFEPSQSGFDWRFERVPGAHVSRLDSAGGDGNRFVLQIDFEDRRVPFQHVRQLLALAPGRYRLMGRVKLDDLRSERGLVWTIYCAEDGRVIGETEPMSGRKPWHSFASDFDVPAQDCGGQWLNLRIPARIPAEQLVGGTVAFDDLKIRSLVN